MRAVAMTVVVVDPSWTGAHGYLHGRGRIADDDNLLKHLLHDVVASDTIHGDGTNLNG